MEVCLAREIKPLVPRERKEFFYEGQAYLNELVTTAKFIT